jgi:hypothetical protein
MVEEKGVGMRGLRRGGVRIALGRRGFAGCLAGVAAAGVGGEETRARLLSLRRKRRGSCRGCRLGGEVEEGRLSSLARGCRLKCGGGGGRVIACLLEGVEVVGFVLVGVVEAVAVEEGSLVVCLMRESTLDLRCRLSRIDEVILGDARERRCGRSSVVLLFGAKGDENRRMAFGWARRACSAHCPCYLGRSFAYCRVSPENRPTLSAHPCAGRYLVAWRTRRDAQGCRDPVPVSRCEWKARCSIGGT